MTRRVSAYERAMRQVIKTETCWLWPGQKTGNGYGLVSDWHPDGRRWKALVHRVVYEQVIGPIPDGLQIDHLCRVRNCCRPDHLEAVTQRENLMRGDTVSSRAAQAVACPYGHPYDDVNTMVDGRGFRVCRTCNREKCRARYWARKSEQVAVGRSMMVGEREADRVHAASST